MLRVERADLVPAADDHVLRGGPGPAGDAEDADGLRVVPARHQHVAVRQPRDACGRRVGLGLMLNPGLGLGIGVDSVV